MLNITFYCSPCCTENADVANNCSRNRKRPIIQRVISHVKQNNWSKTDKETALFYKIRNELSIKQGLLLKLNRIVIPSTLQKLILKTIHPPHQGIVKTKALLREKVWWANISSDIEKLVASCHACKVTDKRTPPPEPLEMTETLKGTWQLVATDLKGPIITGEHILTVIDYKSRYPVVEILETITSADIVHSFRKMFATHGYPETITVDNGTQFKRK